MIILDENVGESQRRWLQRRRIRSRQIGVEIGRMGMNDSDIIPLLHALDRPTLFSLDIDFYRRDLRHQAYCLVYLDVNVDIVAEFIRRVLRHRELNTKAKRMGNVIHVQPQSMTLWRMHHETELQIEWK